MADGLLLDVRNLNVVFTGTKGAFHAVKDICFSMGREKLGIVGESGSGKTVIGRAILKLLPPSARIDADGIHFNGQDISKNSQKEMRAIRGRGITMVMQDPIYSLNPVRTVGSQIIESVLAHNRVSRKEAVRRTLEMLDAVKIRNPEQVYGLYPHEVSGGMGQRIMIAMMLIPEPALLIADEPTSALDVTIQLQVLTILDDLVTRRGMGMIFISHDLELVARFCDRVIVLYAGRIMEICDAKDLLHARHPYTCGLLNCLPRVTGNGGRLPTLERQEAWLESSFSG
jgi:peptide/nickel transport system ATP-binding protein